MSDNGSQKVNEIEISAEKIKYVMLSFGMKHYTLKMVRGTQRDVKLPKVPLKYRNV